MSDKLSANLLFEELGDDEAAILDLTTRAFYTVNPTARRIVDLMRRDASVDVIVATLAAEFDVDRAELRSDVEEFLAQARAAGLLEPG